MTIVLGGRGLTLDQLVAIADGGVVEVDAATAGRMAAGRLVVERYLREAIPAYGLTTGLGMRADTPLTQDEATEFSYRTVRGRTQAIGTPLEPRSVRAVMAARLNTLLDGTAGVSASMAPFIVEMLNRGLIPVMPRIGSIGSGDLVAMASMAHAFIGEGHMVVDGSHVPAADALATAGIEPLRLQPKDGSALCNNTAFSTGLAALACDAAQRDLQSLHVAAALSIASFGGNTTPFDPAVLRARPQPGQVAAGDDLWRLLHDSDLEPRRLQDPLSMRCVPQVHGAAFVAVDALERCVLVELNSSPDNPTVLVDEGRCVSSGNFHLPLLAQCLDAVARSLAWCANDSVSRVQRLMSGALTDLPSLLAVSAADRAGFGPLLKPMEDLRARIIHLSNPVPIMPSHNADGIEDAVTFAALAADKLDELLTLLRLLVAFELIAASQAIDLRGQPIAMALGRVHRVVRSTSPFIDDDRPMGTDVQAVADRLVASGELIAQAYTSV
jgi:histidine ammonia-lyase